MFDSELPVSYYQDLAPLSEKHGVYVVRHVETGKIYVRKLLTVYNMRVYERLFYAPVCGIPRIYAMYEHANALTVIEEYISGDTLAEVCRICGRLPEKAAADYAMKLCRILRELHSFSPPIIHRDVKPENLILTEDGRIVLLDMNAARIVEPGKDSDTRHLGTPGYAAPEQYGFGASTIATDIYGVGTLLGAICPDSLEMPNSPRFRAIVRKCCELEPGKRYSSDDALIRALSHI